MAVSFGAERKHMRYDNIFWVLVAPALASCACFAFEMSCNFAESWNNRFEKVRRGFEMLGGKAKREHRDISFHQLPATNHAERVVLVAEQKRWVPDDIRVLFPATLFGTRVPGRDER
jgi:hypothetical protein